jgi:hypothetical protein
MAMKKTFQRIAVAASLLTACLVADGLCPDGLVVSSAHAVIGRPLTPVSVAGVARRTTRRTIRRTSVYAATLPRGCTTVIVEGATLQQCGGTYYQPYGGQYVVVHVD